MARIRQARKCSAHRKDGGRCGNYAIVGGKVCRMHGGAARQVRRKADERVLMAQAYRVMITVMNSRDYREHEEMRQRALGERRFRDAFAIAAQAWEENG